MLDEFGADEDDGYDLARLVFNAVPKEKVPTEGDFLPLDIASFYGAVPMEVPASIPVDGWTLEVPDNGELVEIGRKHVYTLTPAAKQWCDEMLQDRYWVLGPGTIKRNTLAFYFTTEQDYIMFKMRWT